MSIRGMLRGTGEILDPEIKEVEAGLSRMRKSYEYIVLGGGISGLTAAQVLNRERCRWLLLERCPSLGGLTRSIEVDDFCFDYTGHCLHLRRYPTPADIPYAHLDNGDWRRIKRHSKFMAGDQPVTAPVQYNLGELSPEIRGECVRSYEERPEQRGSGAITFRDYLIGGFGAFLAERFLIPQNEKTMAVPVESLSVNAVKRFFPPPDKHRILAGLRGTASTAGEYNSEFWYPRVGGIGRLAVGLAQELNGIEVNQKVVVLDLEHRSLQTHRGDTFSWDYLITSIPLKAFCQMSGIAELLEMGEKLSHSTTVCFSLGLRGDPPAEMKDTHWIYVPDRRIPFYRVGFYSNISPGSCAPGCSSMYVECGFPATGLPEPAFTGKLQSDVLDWLEQLGWVDRSSLRCLVTHAIPCAYVHHTPARAEAVKSILTRLQRHGVYPIGRYGLWDYLNMEDSIESALSTVARLVGSA